ncbi:MAG: deoxyribodipyrimidine photo-lyase [Rectinema sp.]
MSLPGLASLLEESGVEPERILVDGSAGGRGNSPDGDGTVAPGRDYVLYWMQKAQRPADNPALDLAIHAADRLGLPLLVLFVLTDYPAANPNHYRFMLHGLRECATMLRERGIGFALRAGEPAVVAAEAARHAALVLCDAGRLRIERRWREDLALNLRGGQDGNSGRQVPLIHVETEAVVPPDSVSPKEEYSAATIRPKISGQLPRFLHVAARVSASGSAHVSALAKPVLKAFPSGCEDSRDALFASYDAPATPEYPGDRIAEQTICFKPGFMAGMERFEEFACGGALDRYDADRNDPCKDGQSGMSPYLHFGQVSPVRLAGEALGRPGPSSQAFVEQLVVRRELAANFVLRNPGYDRYESAVPAWAREGLAAVRQRPTVYREADLEAAATQDRFWNAAQNELVLTGKMHNYMRMYWGKRLLAWHADPERAYRIALRFNDRYSLDGRDPNGYSGVAWCFGRHDRPWPLQPLFGNVRAMVPGRLSVKFDAAAYAERVESMYIRNTTRGKR